MASSFPTSFDVFVNPTPSSAPNRSQDIDQLMDSMAAVQTTIGVTGSTVAGTSTNGIGNLQTQPVKADTTTAYTPIASDVGKLVTLSNAGAITLTLPQDSDATIAIGAWIDFCQIGAGLVTVAAGTGATVNNPQATLKFLGRYARIRAQKRAANTWLIGPAGDLAAS